LVAHKGAWNANILGVFCCLKRGWAGCENAPERLQFGTVKTREKSGFLRAFLTSSGCVQNAIFARLEFVNKLREYCLVD
jgi:hypothetical protein